MYIPVDKDAVIKAGRVNAGDSLAMEEYIDLNMLDDPEGGMRLSKIIATDMLATNAENGWKRPIYFAMTVPDDYYMGLSPYMQSTGMAYEVGPVKNPGAAYGNMGVNTDKAYDNIVNKFRWGGIDKAKSADDIYLDETVRRMVTTTRSTMLDLATALYNEGVIMDEHYMTDSVNMTDSQRAEYKARIADRYKKSREVVDLMVEKLPAYTSPYGCLVAPQLIDIYARLALATDDTEAHEKAMEILTDEIGLAKQYLLYIQSLTPAQFYNLSRTDRYIYDTYFLNLLQLYASIGGDSNKLIEELQNEGIDFSRYVQRQQKESAMDLSGEDYEYAD